MSIAERHGRTIRPAIDHVVAVANRIVRSSPNLFVVLPGHEVLEVDQVLEARERFSLVEKTKHTDLVLTWQREPPAKGA